MKKLVYFFCLLCAAQLTAQNTFPTTGNVGIGTLTPTEDLEVVGKLKINGTLLLEGDNNGFSAIVANSSNSSYYNYRYIDHNNQLRLDSNTLPDSFYLNYMDQNGNSFFNIYDDSLFSFMALRKTDTKLMIGGFGGFGTSHNLLVNSGTSYFNENVGIGTENFIDTNDNNLEYMLSVEGRVRAHEVKVYTSWADFVFEEGYNLPSLNEVEAYIKKEGHLKDIPSAEEVKSKGIQLGEMNKLLLQKIEELTLYTIEQQKLIIELQSDVKKLMTKNN